MTRSIVSTSSDWLNMFSLSDNKTSIDLNLEYYQQEDTIVYIVYCL